MLSNTVKALQIFENTKQIFDCHRYLEKGGHVYQNLIQDWVCQKLQMFMVRCTVLLNTSCLCTIWRRKHVYVCLTFLQTIQSCMYVPYLIFSFIYFFQLYFLDRISLYNLFGFIWFGFVCVCISALLRSLELGTAFRTNLTAVVW